MCEGKPYSESVSHVDFGGFYLTHVIWHNSYGSVQPETGVRSHAAALKDFRLVEHGSQNWPMVTIVMFAALAKGWDAYRIGRLIEWLDRRYRARPQFR